MLVAGIAVVLIGYAVLPLLNVPTPNKIVSSNVQSFSGAIYQTQDPVSAGNTFYGEFNVSYGRSGPYSSNSLPSLAFYILTPAQYDSWQSKSGNQFSQSSPPDFAYGASTSNSGGSTKTSYIYYSNNQTVSFPFRLVSNISTPYYLVIMYFGNSGQGSYSARMLVNALISSGGLSVLSPIIGSIGFLIIGFVGERIYVGRKKSQGKRTA
jgi:hypothetical protein